MVTDPYTRHPALTAMAIATLDEMAGGRAILGLGAGVAGFTAMHIIRHHPAQAMREAVTVVRDLWRGETVDMHGEVISLAHGRLDFRPVRPRVPVYIASNGPMGLALAGEIADGAVMQGAAAPVLLDWFIAQVQRGAQRAGRALSEVDLVARLNLCIHADARLARDVMRPTIARSLIAQQPHFRTFVTAGLDIPVSLRTMLSSMGYTHDPALLAPVAALIPDAFVDAMTLAGTVEDIAAQVVRLVQHGVTQVMVYPIAPDGDVERILRSFAREVMPRVQESI
jgi:5,10-methylenetetrahydromethanopterin reductase